MAETKLHHSKWSIAEMWESKDLVGSMFARTFTNDKVYPRDHSDIKNLETAMRLGGKGLCAKPSNYPMKSVRQVLEKYDTNGKWYDFSCGRGVRLLGALHGDIEYYGTDPNYKLTERLNEMAQMYCKVNNVDRKVDIRTQGSEHFIKEWENSFGLVFSSPPYFNLENYKIGEQSYTSGDSYNDWIEKYYEPTIINLRKYVTDTGHVLININNFDNYDLVGDTKALCEKNGLEYVESLDLKNIQRPKSSGGVNDNSERIMVFKKTQENPIDHNIEIDPTELSTQEKSDILF